MRKNGVKQNFTVALFELMNLKPYDKISISDLVSKSACSRASFYRNYSSKEQIIEEYITKAFGNTFVRHPLNKENMREEVLCIFREINEQRAVLYMLNQAEKLDVLDKLLYHETLQQINRMGVLNNQYQPFFFAGAVASMIRAWVRFGFKESPEQMTEIFFKSLRGYMSID